MKLIQKEISIRRIYDAINDKITYNNKIIDETLELSDFQFKRISNKKNITWTLSHSNTSIKNIGQIINGKPETFLTLKTKSGVYLDVNYLENKYNKLMRNIKLKNINTLIKDELH